MSNREVLVVGCGVSGLTSGIRLIEEGFSVEIVTDATTPNTTSDRAGAIWYPHPHEPQERTLVWARRTRERLLELASVPDAGISVIERIEVFDHPAPDPWWMPAAGVVRRLHPEELPPGYRDGIVTDVPLIETPIYMRYLMERFRRLGGTIRVIDHPIIDLRELLHERRLLVNCTGLGAGRLFNDPDLFPIRGQVVKVSNPGLRRAITDRTGHLALSYIIPRSDGCILGGTRVDGEWSTEVDQETSRGILERCRTLEPGVRDAQVLDAWVGLRPGRAVVRVEQDKLDDRHIVIHNYGHGGSGFTLSWGCADDVAELAKEVVARW
jgi:D-amino-acid oxidase